MAFIVDFTSKTFGVELDGSPIAGPVPIYSKGGLASLGVATDGYISSAESSLFYDDLSVTPTPEPAAVSLLILGGLALGRRMRRRG